MGVFIDLLIESVLFKLPRLVIYSVEIFLGGNELNIADLIATATLEQSFLIDFERSSDLQNYLDRCSEVIPEYHEILNDLKAAPKRIRPNW